MFLLHLTAPTFIAMLLGAITMMAAILLANIAIAFVRVWWERRG